MKLLEGDIEKYYGKYVAVSSFNSRKVVAYDNDLAKAIQQAQEKGIREPVVFRVPRPGEIQLFACLG